MMIKYVRYEVNWCYLELKKYYEFLDNILIEYLWFMYMDMYICIYVYMYMFWLIILFI